MKRITIKNLDGIQIAGAEMLDPTEWIFNCEAIQAWGAPDSYTVEIEDISHEHELREVITKRVAEYPSAADFLNAFFDGGLEELREKRLAIKAKYPKPIQE